MTTLLPGNIVYGGRVQEMEYQNYRSLGHYVTEKLKSFDDKIILIDGLTGQEYSSKHIYQAVVRLAYALQKLGIKSGDVIGLSSENRFESSIVIFAGFALNATVALLNNTYTKREAQHAFNLSKPKVIFTSKQTIDNVLKIAKSSSYIKNIVMFGLLRSNSKIHSFDDLIENPKNAMQKDFFCAFANKNEEVALIVYSSGTTGLPKGVQLTQLNVLAGINPAQIGIEMESPTLLAVLPWFHVFGCMLLLTAATIGKAMVYLPRFEPQSFLSSIEKYRIKVSFMVPPLMVFLAKHPLVDKYDLSSLEMLFCGAAPLSKETGEQIKKRLGPHILILQGFGMSETTRGTLVQNDKFCKPGSVGVLKGGLYAKVIDPNTGKALGPNERGELCFQGDLIMKGYIGDDKSTKNTIKDGWLHTGDIAYFDENFEFFVVDRIKELIKYKGFQVPPAEIEALLLTMDKVKDSAVIGKPDESAGELPMAFVVKQPNVELTQSEVIQFVAERTSPAKRLRGGVVFIDEIPKTPSGKILRRELRDLIKNKPKSKL